MVALIFGNERTDEERDDQKSPKGGGGGAAREFEVLMILPFSHFWILLLVTDSTGERPNNDWRGFLSSPSLPQVLRLFRSFAKSETAFSTTLISQSLEASKQRVCSATHRRRRRGGLGRGRRPWATNCWGLGGGKDGRIIKLNLKKLIL